jgi:hypothetical protein
MGALVRTRSSDQWSARPQADAVIEIKTSQVRLRFQRIHTRGRAALPDPLQTLRARLTGPGGFCVRAIQPPLAIWAAFGMAVDFPVDKLDYAGCACRP